MRTENPSMSPAVESQDKHNMGLGMYGRLGAMTALSFVSMYILMYAMADSIGDVFNSTNQVYMAGLMTAPMVILELLLMNSMYQDKTKNLIILVVAAAALLAFFSAIRFQAAIGDNQFLRSMIPHHSGAILMCREAKISDPQLKQLCSEIIESQRREIVQMKALLSR